MPNTTKTRGSRRANPYDTDRLRPTAALVEAHIALDEAIQRRATGPLGLDNYTSDLLVRLMRAPERQLRGVNVSRQLLISASRTTRLIDRAEAAGLVERCPDPDDRRAQLIRLTPEGERAARDYAPLLLDVLDRVVFQSMDATERETLIELLGRLRDSARAVAAD